jgi:hypothetical protein
MNLETNHIGTDLSGGLGRKGSGFFFGGFLRGAMCAPERSGSQDVAWFIYLVICLMMKCGKARRKLGFRRHTNQLWHSMVDERKKTKFGREGEPA